MKKLTARHCKVGLLLCLLVSYGCASKVHLKVPMVHTRPLSPEPAIYVAPFSDLRPYNEVGKSEIGDKFYAKEQVGEVVAKIFVDELRKENINAVFSPEPRPAMAEDDLLIEAQVTDYLVRVPFFFSIFRSVAAELRMQISVLNSDGETLISRELATSGTPPLIAEAMNALRRESGVGTLYGVMLDDYSRRLCQRLINTTEFKKALEQ